MLKHNTPALIMSGAADGTGEDGGAVMGLSGMRGGGGGDIRQMLTDEEKVAIGSLFQMLEPFREKHPTMTLQTVLSFLLVCLEEGHPGVRDYATRAGVSQTVMTRNLLDLGHRNRAGEPGLGLVQQRSDPMDLRRTQTFLTNQGAALAHKVIRALRQGCASLKRAS